MSAENPADQSATVPMHKYTALRTVLRDRERELLQLKGPCSWAECGLHHAHIGPCDIRKAARDGQ